MSTVPVATATVRVPRDPATPAPARLPHRGAATARTSRPSAAAAAALRGRYDRVVARTAAAAAAATPLVVRGALAVVMLWFGLPKLVAGGSPAEDLVLRTLDALTAGLVTGDAARLLVGALEIGLGIALLVGRAMPLVLLVLLGHLAGTTAPLVLFPSETWYHPGVGTLEGQYILKNVVLVACAVVLAGHEACRRTRAP